MSEIKNKVILITGGSQGLGKALVKKFSKNNTVVVISNDKSSLDEVLNAFSCIGYLCNVTDYKKVEGVVKNIERKYKRLDILINNAGVWVGGKLEDNSAEDIARVLFVNTVGVIYTTKAVVPLMRKQREGKILNINSINGLTVKKERGPYIASKWAITGFTKAMECELAEYGIEVMGIYPGLMNTNLFKNAKAKRDMTNALDPDVVVEAINYMLSCKDKALPEELIIKHIDY